MSNAAPKTEAPRPASADNNTTIKTEDGQQEASRNEWTSERDLVSSLWKLQELESKVRGPPPKTQFEPGSPKRL
jgi:hypothetical protein